MLPCQTGFIPNMGTNVNLIRAIEQIRKRTDQGRIIYGLFLDYANAYNSIPHVLLFKKLRQKNCLTEEEIEYLENLYSWYHVRLGKNIFRVNKGVAQGSIISPALFNIFIEDFGQELVNELGLNLDDVLLYADDVLILCSSFDQLTKVINFAESWSRKNGMKLNKSKSAIVPFAPRSAKTIPFLSREENPYSKKKEWKALDRSVLEIPIKTEYKYLGVVLNFKLLLEPQINYIKKKASWIFIKLYPYLTQASADGRRDMWTLMVAPLFIGLGALMSCEYSVSLLKEAYSIWRNSFKQFLFIPKTTSTEVVYQMIGVDLVELVIKSKKIAQEKWTARKQHTDCLIDETLKIPRYNPLIGISNIFCQIIKLEARKCIAC